MADTRHSSTASSRRPKPGNDSVGQFIVGSEIGKGSFAQVYIGKHKVSSSSLPCTTGWIIISFLHRTISV